MMQTTLAHAPQTQAQRLAALEPLLAKFRERMRQYDDTSKFPAPNFEELKRAGLHCLTVPKEYGGAGLWRGTKFADWYEILEVMAKADPSTSQLLQVHSHATGIVAWHGKPEQKARFLREVVEEGKLIASAGSEADPKSKTGEGMKSEMTPVDGGYKLNCFKHFASLGPAADYFLIWTQVPGEGPLSARQLFALVPRDAQGVELVDEWDVLGMRSTVSWGVKITDHFVSHDRVIGEPGCWVRDPRTFTLAYVANHIGSAEGAYAVALDFVRQRPDLSQSETVKAALGDLASRLYAARAALYAAAGQWEAAGAVDWRRDEHDKAEMMGLQALHIAKRVSLDVAERAFDICGARSTFRTLPLEQMYRDIRTFTLHFRDDLYMIRVAEGLLDPSTFEAKGKYKRLDAVPNVPVGT
jgi:alkylation response protein AidB-like acyl-CoA dehydrogenase